MMPWVTKSTDIGGNETRRLIVNKRPRVGFSSSPYILAQPQNCSNPLRVRHMSPKAIFVDQSCA